MPKVQREFIDAVKRARTVLKLPSEFEDALKRARGTTENLSAFLDDLRGRLAANEPHTSSWTRLDEGIERLKRDPIIAKSPHTFGFLDAVHELVRDGVLTTGGLDTFKPITRIERSVKGGRGRPITKSKPTDEDLRKQLDTRRREHKSETEGQSITQLAKEIAPRHGIGDRQAKDWIKAAIARRK
jgi:hypothetical protein